MLINKSSTFAVQDKLREKFNSQKPFRFIVIDNFLSEIEAEKILKEWPSVDNTWVDAAGLNTRKKFTQPIVNGTVAAKYFEAISTPEFLKFIEHITNIKDIVPDPAQFGGGYHHIIEGGYLNVHIDFNKHDHNHDLDRRLNIILYLNKDWKTEYGGCLELWDKEKNIMLAEVAPIFNRCVIFETNEISYHGHPKPIVSGKNLVRRSLASYYYTYGRDDVVNADKHSTVYMNTEGLSGVIKNFRAGVIHLFKKIKARLQ